MLAAGYIVYAGSPFNAGGRALWVGVVCVYAYICICLSMSLGVACSCMFIYRCVYTCLYIRIGLYTFVCECMMGVYVYLVCVFMYTQGERIGRTDRVNVVIVLYMIWL